MVIHDELLYTDFVLFQDLSVDLYIEAFPSWLRDTHILEFLPDIMIAGRPGCLALPVLVFLRLLL